MWYIRENGIISQCSTEKIGEDWLYTDKNIVYDGNGKLRFEDEITVIEKENHKAKLRLEKIRANRENLCFPVINRGQLWYANLSETQKNELAAWYSAWLDAPQTLNEPDKPSWLD